MGSLEMEKKMEELKKICDEYTYKRDRLVKLAQQLFEKRKGYVNTICTIAEELENISGLPKWCEESTNEWFENIRDFQTAVKYENDPQKFEELTIESGRAAAYWAGGAAAAGGALGAFGSTAAMSVATVLGTASTGTAISTLSGAAATNAALAWLGGGAVATGGAGVAGGSFILGLFGPIGAAIAGVSAISGIALVRSKNRKQVENIDKHIDSIRHDIQSLDQKIQRLCQIMNRSDYNNETRLKPTLKWIKKIQPKKYKEWNDDQRHELEKLVNVVSNTVQLINERV
ncbi:hypothetical protein SAMN05216462_0346 [Xylanibacter ruminicola]|uniref:Uncharacterized protein n=2 Tax=Xylanibacter ruminicola TaxID=839 RepID=A0A1H3XV51_XYLRU|nr:hypothetical protein SAMN05216462_0346 [Xylanibacter ruminicola]